MQPGTQSGLRDKLIAALLVGAVVVVIGYAPGLGVRPGGTPAAAAPQPPAAAPAPATSLPPVVPPAGPPVAPVQQIAAPNAPAVTATTEPGHVHDPSHHHGDGHNPPASTTPEPPTNVARADRTAGRLRGGRGPPRLPDGHADLAPADHP